MIESIEHLAHNIQQVTRWSDHNQAPTESHFTQIMQAGLNMPKSGPTGNDLGWDHRGLALWAPHRSNQLDQFRDEVMSTIHCNIDWSHTNLKATLVFLLTPSQPCPHTPLAITDRDNHAHNLAERSRYWSEAKARALSDPNGYSWGDPMPSWLCQYVMNATLSLSASALQARQLGYHVQFLSLQRASRHMLTHFPHACEGQPYMPFVALSVGTHADQRQMSARRNRTYGTVTHQDHLFHAEGGVVNDVDQPIGTAWSDELISSRQNQLQHSKN